MFAGLSSNLKRYEDGILTLEIHNTAQHLPSDDATALKMATCWKRWNKELSDAKGYVAVFYKTRFTGFAISAAAITPDTPEQICRGFKEAREELPELVRICGGLLSEAVDR
jgi:hypothetical protein